jgi:hypothetical protein
MLLTEAVLNEVKAAYLSGYEKGYVDGNQSAVEAKVSKFIDAHTKPWVGLTEEEVGSIEHWVMFREAGSGPIPVLKLIAYIEEKLKEKNHAV